MSEQQKRFVKTQEAQREFDEAQLAVLDAANEWSSESPFDAMGQSLALRELDAAVTKWKQASQTLIEAHRRFEDR